MIRAATRADAADLVRMAHAFHDAIPALASVPFNDRIAAQSVMMAIYSPDMLVLALDLEGAKGVLAAQLIRYPLGDAMLAREIIFWIDPEVRGRWALKMLLAYEAWAKDRGAVLIGVTSTMTMDHPATKLFERAGFAVSEVNLMKVA